jgi:hypothetical protein
MKPRMDCAVCTAEVDATVHEGTHELGPAPLARELRGTPETVVRWKAVGPVGAPRRMDHT